MRAITALSRNRLGARVICCANTGWLSPTRSGTSSKESQQALDLEGARPRHRPADRLGVRRPRRRHARPSTGSAGALARAPVLHRRLGALCRGFVSRPPLRRQGPDPAHREQHCPPATLVCSPPPPHLRRLQVGCHGRGDLGSSARAAAPDLFAFYHCNGGRLTPALTG